MSLREQAPSSSVQEPGRCLSRSRPSASPQKCYQAVGSCTHVTHPLEKGRPLGTEVSLLRCVPARGPPWHGAAHGHPWVPPPLSWPFCPFPLQVYLGTSHVLVGSSPAAPGLKSAWGEVTLGTRLLEGPPFRAFLSKKEQCRDRGNKPAQ